MAQNSCFLEPHAARPRGGGDARPSLLIIRSVRKLCRTINVKDKSTQIEATIGATTRYDHRTESARQSLLFEVPSPARKKAHEYPRPRQKHDAQRQSSVERGRVLG